MDKNVHTSIDMTYQDFKEIFSHKQHKTWTSGCNWPRPNFRLSY